MKIHLPALISIAGALFSASASAGYWSGTSVPTETVTSSDGDHAITLMNAAANRAWRIFQLHSGDVAANGFLLEYYDGSTSHRRFTVDQAGRVGIGVVNPSSALDIAGVLELNDNTFLSSHASPGNRVTFLGANAYWTGGAYVTPNASEPAFVLELHQGSRSLNIREVPAGGGYAPPDTRIGVHGTDTYFNGFGGNVGIGTISPAHKLDVNGTVRAKEVVVETNWPDYVFEPGYRLRPVEEVEAYILEKGRLPDVPSAGVVEAEGLPLGDAQRIMMQKIEELTLYMIGQEKRIKALESENARLREERE